MRVFYAVHPVATGTCRGRLICSHLSSKTPNPFASDSRVAHLRCDRLNEGKRFRALLAAGPPVGPTCRVGEGEGVGDGAAGRMWDAVVDFVCFRKKGMEDVRSQAHRIGHYVLISSDSGNAARDWVLPLASKFSLHRSEPTTRLRVSLHGL